MLCLIGLGLGNEEDISLKGLELVKNADLIFLEYYTSTLVGFDKARMEKLYGKEIIIADRTLIEQGCEEKILEPAKEQHVVLLIAGSPLAATTHLDILSRAHEMGVKTKVLDNASVLTAIGITGLSLYKFGRVTTIPREHKDITSPYDMMLENKKMGLHSLILLDVYPEENGLSFFSARKGLDYLISCGLDPESQVVICGALGSENEEIKVGKAKDISISAEPQCIIVPGSLHFSEEEALKQFY